MVPIEINIFLFFSNVWYYDISHIYKFLQAETLSF